MNDPVRARWAGWGDVVGWCDTVCAGRGRGEPDGLNELPRGLPRGIRIAAVAVDGYGASCSSSLDLVSVHSGEFALRWRISRQC